MCGLLDVTGNLRRAGALFFDRDRDGRGDFGDAADGEPDVLGCGYRILVALFI